jgi:uncharacterized protein YaaN involved in tellurite resistance
VSGVPVPQAARAPEAGASATAEAGAEPVPLKPELRSAIAQQVARLTEALLQDGLHAEAFKVRLQWIAALGREEVADAADLMQGALMQRHVAGLQDRAAHQALADLRAQIEALDPDRDGELLKPRKLFGLIPLGGNRLDAYFRRHAQAVPAVQALVAQLYAARDGLQRDVVDIEAVRAKLWEAMQKLAAAACFARLLDARLAVEVQALQASDPPRARTLSEDALFCVRQNLQDIQTQQAVCMNGYLALDVLRKTGRELITGCTRVATTGLSALAVAQVVARALGHQAQVVDLLGGVNASIDALAAQTSRQLGAYAAQGAQFARDPALGLDRIREMLGQTVQAIEAMDLYRGEAEQALGRTGGSLRQQLGP